MAAQPGNSIPEIAGGWPEAKGFYRLLDAGEVDDQVILGGHRKATLGRASGSAEEVFLAVQDTTTLNFTSHGKLGGQGPIGDGAKATGLHVHSCLLVGAQGGESFGLLGSKLYAREGGKRRAQKAGARNREPLREKESYRWMEGLEAACAAQAELRQRRGEVGEGAPTVVSVGDREADIYELLAEAEAHRGRGLALLVRSQHNRAATGDGGREARSWQQLERSPCRGRVRVTLPASQGAAARELELQVRFTELTIGAPAHKAKYLGLHKDVTLWAVELREDAAAKGAVRWRLLSTLPVESLGQAVKVSRYYALRWQIEVFHRVLKTGCRVERRQMRRMERMRPMIALDMVVACMVMGLRDASRKCPHAPAARWLQPEELLALGAFSGMQQAEASSLSVAGAGLLIAKLGGFLARKGDGPPGAEVIWRGLRKLHAITAAYLAFR